MQPSGRGGSKRALALICRLSATARIAEATHTRPDQYCVSQRPLHTALHLQQHRELRASRRAQTIELHASRRTAAMASTPMRQVRGRASRRTHRKNAKAHTKRRRRAPGHDLALGRRFTVRGGRAYPPEPQESVRVETARRRNPWSRLKRPQSVLRLVREVPNSKVLFEGVPNTRLEEGRAAQAHVSPTNSVQEFRPRSKKTSGHCGVSR